MEREGFQRMNQDRSKTFNHEMYKERKEQGLLNIIEPVWPQGLTPEEQIGFANEHTPRVETFQEWQKRMCKG